MSSFQKVCRSNVTKSTLTYKYEDSCHMWATKVPANSGSIISTRQDALFSMTCTHICILHFRYKQLNWIYFKVVHLHKMSMQGSLPLFSRLLHYYCIVQFSVGSFISKYRPLCIWWLDSMATSHFSPFSLPQHVFIALAC